MPGLPSLEQLVGAPSEWAIRRTGHVLRHPTVPGLPPFDPRLAPRRRRHTATRDEFLRLQGRVAAEEAMRSEASAGDGLARVAPLLAQAAETQPLDVQS